MAYQNKLREDLEALAALLGDIATQLEHESESSGRLRELHQQCLMELDLMKDAETKGSE